MSLTAKNESLCYRFPDKPIHTNIDFIDSIKEEEWITQGKYDGHRCLICTDVEVHGIQTESGVNLLSRHAKLLKNKHIAELKANCEELNLPPKTVIDSEFVGPRGHFPPSLFIFDCLAWDGEWLTNMPFFERWEFCARVFDRLPNKISLAETVHSDFKPFFNRLKLDSLSQNTIFEGIVIKRKKGLLFLKSNACADNPHMFKVKFR